MFRGTTNAGRASRELYVYEPTDGESMLVAIHSAQGNFLADIRLDAETAFALADHLGRWADEIEDAKRREEGGSA